MHDCIILGSGRSGTSMVAGALARAGYFMGEGLFPPRASNPKGFFEAPEVNALNELLLAPRVPASTGLGPGQRWLAWPDSPLPAEMPAELAARAELLVARRPFCFKDPRFSFTLPAWRPLLGEARFVCVFRDPALTAASLIEETRRAAYLSGVELEPARAFELWRRQYAAVLDEHAGAGEWLFLHYDQVLQGEGLERLERFLGAPVDPGFPDRRLRRAGCDLEAPREARELYSRLCARAGHPVEGGDSAPRVAVSAAGAAGEEASVPRIAVAAIVGESELERVPELLEDVRGQRGVEAELVLVDATRAGGLEAALDTMLEGRLEAGLEAPCVRVVRCAAPSRGRAWRAAAEHAGAELMALALPGCRMLPSRLAHAAQALEAAPGALLCAADLYLCDAQGQFVARSSPAAMGAAPGPFFEAGLVLRRAAIPELDTRAFVPAELALYACLLETGRVTHAAEPGVVVERALHDGAWERSRADAALVALARRPAPAAPALTVSICTFDRREVLAECLEAFARQLVEPGTFELVVVDDGSRDGTAEWLDELDMPVPLRVLHQENQGLAAARNAGLELARGRIVLFANDDTIPEPDCVERHLLAHAAREGQPVCVLGSFEQPPTALANALMRYLEGSTEVFGFARLQPGEIHDGTHFWTCNVSAPLEAVRRAGGFDPSFRHYGCEDTDLGLRLEALGCRVLYEPRARAWHRHVLSFEDFARRQRTVARAYVRLARKHPGVLARWGNQELEGDWLCAQLGRWRGLVPQLEAAARELARVDVGALEGLGEPHAGAVSSVLEGLAELVPRLDRLWQWQGFLEGLREHGLSGFAELLAAGEGPHRFHDVVGGDGPRDAQSAPPRLLAFPRWDEPADLRRLMQLAAPAAGFATLVLRFDPAREGPREQALGRLEAAYAEVLPAEARLDVLLEEAPLGRAELLRLGRSVEALLFTGPSEGEPFALVVAERLASPEAVAAWRRRFGPHRGVPQDPTRSQGPSRGSAGAAPERAPAHGAAPLLPRACPELTVLLPTRERPRELVQCLEHLAAQDLEPARFEVVVVDDGSGLPAADVLAGRRWPFELACLRQEAAGPAAARNLGLGRARGEVVLFLNDDAVPLPDCARRHLEAHRRAYAQVAVLGTFDLLARHVVDSLAWHVETSTALFAQPRMQAGVLYGGAAFCTGNLSVEREALLRAGGFDASLPHAGGEDTELGLRLGREQGLRVLYDPRIRCGHDHALEVEALARRHQVLGWVAHRIQERHPAAGLVPGWPLSDEAWVELAAGVERSAAGLAQLVERARGACEAERRAGAGPTLRARLRPLFEALQEQAFHAGLVRAHLGQPALDPTPLAPRDAPLEPPRAAVRVP